MLYSQYTCVLSIHTVLYMVTDVHHQDFAECHNHLRFYKYVPVLFKTRIKEFYLLGKKCHQQKPGEKGWLYMLSY